MRALSEYSDSATFSCKHKVTKMPICATPCDGIKDFCENDSDEQCQGIGLVVILAITLSLATLFLVVEFLMKTFICAKTERQGPERFEMSHNSRSNENDLSYFKKRLWLHNCKLDFEGAVKLALEFYGESSVAKDDESKHLMQILGTNKLTAYFFDCIDRSIMIRVGAYLQHNTPTLLLVMNNGKLRNACEVIHCIASLTTRYSDLPKDAFFLYLIWVQLGNYRAGSFPIVIFWTLFSSIVAAEVLNCIIAMNHQSLYKGRHIFRFVLCPLTPAFIMYETLHIKLKLGKVGRKAKNSQVLEEKIHKYEMKCCRLQMMTAKMQCTENVLENLTMLTILIMVIALGHTRSRAVENIDNIFVEKNEFLGYTLAGMSFLSMIRGQTTFLKASKNGCLGLIGTLLVTPYYVLGTCSR